MAETVTLQDTFHGGVRRDHSRDQMPKGSLWWAEDMLPNLDARLRERGGWTSASDSTTGVHAGADTIDGGVFAPFAAGSKNLAISNNLGVTARLVEIAANGDVTDIGQVNGGTYQSPVFHRDLVIITYNVGVTLTPQKYDGSTIATLGGSPPAAIYATVWNDRTLIARTNANPNRLWFSDPGDPEGWDTTNAIWDFSYPIKGLASLRTAILVFHESHTSRLRGTAPPPGGDLFADDPMWNVGCSDARSIAYWNDRVLFASAEGIFITDGAGVDDITAKCGVLRYWQDTMADYDSDWVMSGGILRDHYFIFVHDGGVFKAGAAIDLRRLAFWPITNIIPMGMWPGQGAADELYFGRRDDASAGSLSSVFSPTSTVKNDGDGDAVTGLIETPFYRGRSAQKGWRRLFTTHYLRDYASDNPTVTVGYITTPEDTSYTSISTTLSELSAEDRKILPLGFSSRGLGLQFSRANAGDWQLNAIEADVNQREGSR